MVKNEENLYTPLAAKHEIRLIYLSPENKELGDLPEARDEIHCSLVHVDLDEKPIYEALSYEWGEDETRRGSGYVMNHIWIDETKVFVRRNLWWALKYIRSDETRTLWVDALCINQADVNERNHQVSQMGQIYSNASKVLIWSGLTPESLFKKEWLEPFKSLDQDLKRYAEAKNTTLQMEVRTRRAYVFLHIIQLERLCKWSYWGRLWIIQEVVLAHKIQIHILGSVVQLDTLSEFLDLIETDESNLSGWVKDVGSKNIFTRKPSTSFTLLDGDGHDHYRILRNGSSYLKEYRNIVLDSDFARLCKQRSRSITNPPYDEASLTIFELIEQHKEAKCQDSHDKIFGLFSLAPDCCVAAFPVDYSKDLTHLCYGVLEHQISEHVRPREDNILDMSHAKFLSQYLTGTGSLLLLNNGRTKKPYISDSELAILERYRR